MIKYQVKAEDDSRRVDRILKSHFEEVGYSFLQKIFRKGLVKINKKKALPDTKVFSGDEIEIFINISEKEKPELCEHLRSRFLNMIIFESDDFLAINKPVKLAVQGGTKIKLSVENLMLSYNNNCRLVHRLDKDTSGVLLIAKNMNSAKDLTQQFKDGLIKKTYFAVVHGKIEEKTFLESFLDTKFIGGKEMQVVSQSGKAAKTAVEPIAIKNGFSLLKLTPFTGRKHQIRVQLSSLLGSPILGDTRYGIFDGFQRLFLHAQKISIYNRSIIAPIPLEFKELFQNFIES